MRIYKYNISFGGDRIVSAPQGAKLLSFQSQGGQLSAWFEVDISNPLVDHPFTIVLTGEEVPADAGNYFTTVQWQNYVLHIYYAGVTA